MKNKKSISPKTTDAQVRAELERKFPSVDHHIYYCEEPFNQTVDGLQQTVIGDRTIFYKLYPSNSKEKNTLRWTDKPNLLLGFKNVVFFFSE